MGLCDADVTTLLDFLYDLTEALERHYTGELMRRNYPRPDAPPRGPDTDLDDPPF